MKIVQFSRPPTPLVHLRPKFYHPLDLGRSISNEPPFPLQMITNKLMTVMLSGPSGWLSSFILSGFPLTSFHLAEASLSAFSWFYTLACVVYS